MRALCVYANIMAAFLARMCISLCMKHSTKSLFFLQIFPMPTLNSYCKPFPNSVRVRVRFKWHFVYSSYCCRCLSHDFFTKICNNAKGCRFYGVCLLPFYLSLRIFRLAQCEESFIFMDGEFFIRFAIKFELR